MYLQSSIKVGNDNSMYEIRNNVYIKDHVIARNNYKITNTQRHNIHNIFHILNDWIYFLIIVYTSTSFKHTDYTKYMKGMVICIILAKGYIYLSKVNSLYFKYRDLGILHKAVHIHDFITIIIAIATIIDIVRYWGIYCIYGDMRANKVFYIIMSIICYLNMTYLLILHLYCIILSNYNKKYYNADKRILKFTLKRACSLTIS